MFSRRSTTAIVAVMVMTMITTSRLMSPATPLLRLCLRPPAPIMRLCLRLRALMRVRLTVIPGPELPMLYMSPPQLGWAAGAA